MVLHSRRAMPHHHQACHATGDLSGSGIVHQLVEGVVGVLGRGTGERDGPAVPVSSCAKPVSVTVTAVAFAGIRIDEISVSPATG